MPQILQEHRQCPDLIKVGGKPVHDHIEGVVEGEVVDDDGPDGGLSEHSQPWCGRRSALLLRFSSSQWDGCQPASSGHQSVIFMTPRYCTICLMFNGE